MKIKALIGNGECYTNKKGRDVYPYAIVSATAAEKALYKKISVVYVETEKGEPIWYASESYGPSATLEFTRNKDRVYCPLRNQRKAQISAMRASGINVDRSAQDLLAQMFSYGTRSTSVTTEEEETEPETEKKAAKAKKVKAAVKKGMSNF